MKYLITLILTFSYTFASEKELIVLATPKITDHYYKEKYEEIINFQIDLAKKILLNDRLMILADEAALNRLKKHIPRENLKEFATEDIWMRDPMPVKLKNTIQFRYAAAAQGGSQKEADFTQNRLTPILKKLSINYTKSKYILDGGNIVSSLNKMIVTDRFLKDNQLSYSKAKSILKKLSGLNHIAIVPNDDPNGLGHVDGMMSFIDENLLLVNKYHGEFRKRLWRELRQSFPKLQIIEVPVKYHKKVWDHKFTSACGIHLNILSTKNTLYVPTFNSDRDKKVLKLIKESTTKKIVEIDASNVCEMGGSVRCLSWQY